MSLRNVRARLWWALGALALGLLVLAPALAPLSGSMDALSGDLANGSFRPFGSLAGGLGKTPSGSLGGFTGSSSGNYVPGAAEVPTSWLMDRDGTGGAVVIDSVFNPDLGAMKRLKAYDRVGVDGATLDVADRQLRVQSTASADPTIKYDTQVVGSFQVQLHANEPVPIFSPHPKALVVEATVTPALKDRLTIVKDGADTFYVLAAEDKLVTLNISYLVSKDYYTIDNLPASNTGQYASAVRARVPADLAQQAQAVLARAGVQDPRDVPGTLNALASYFRGFTEGDIPPPSEVQSLYQALALGGHGCCRHRAFAFMVTAQSVGIPTRVVVNEAHAFVESMTPDGHWHQINLGGCGTYSLNNPNHFDPLVGAAQNPRGEANPDEGRPAPTTPTATDITDAPSRIVKGETYFVNGTVRAGGRPVPGAPVDVFLNATKTAPGVLTGTGSTAPDGSFSIAARVPADADAQSYQLVARSSQTIVGAVRFGESWSDPAVDVFAPTHLVLPRVSAAAGFPARVAGQLVDVDGRALAAAPVTWSVDGAAGGRSVTDDRGVFNATTTINATGNHTFEARYAGDAHHGVAALTTTITVAPGAILLPAEAPKLTRGAPETIEGDLLVSGIDLAGLPISARIDLLLNFTSPAGVPLINTTTDAAGHFALRWTPPASLPRGIYAIKVDAPTQGLRASGLVVVLARATLSLDSPESVAPGEGWVATARLVDDHGDPIAGSIVDLSLDGTGTRSLLTNRTGAARFELPPIAALGAHEVRASFPGDATAAAAAQSATMRVVPPLYARIPAWGYAMGAGLVLLVPVAVWLLRAGGPLRRARAAHKWSRRVVLDFPELPAGSAPTVEPGSAIAVRARILDLEGNEARGRILLSWPGGRMRLASGELVRVVAAREGPLPLHARNWRARPADAMARAQSWREAVETTFVMLRARAGLPPSATPGDVVRANPAAARAARMFELAEYSEAPVDADFYRAFCQEVAASG